MTDVQSESPGRLRETAGQTVEQGRELAHQGVEKAKETAGQARGALSRQLDERSTIAGERVTAAAAAARRVASELRNDGEEQTARLAEGAADRVERLGGYLRDADGDRMLRDVEGFARRRPWVAAIGGFLIGVAASRFVKASAEARSGNGSSGSYETPVGWGTSPSGTTYGTGAGAYDPAYGAPGQYGSAPTGADPAATNVLPSEHFQPLSEEGR